MRVWASSPCDTSVPYLAHSRPDQTRSHKKLSKYFYVSLFRVLGNQNDSLKVHLFVQEVDTKLWRHQRWHAEGAELNQGEVLWLHCQKITFTQEPFKKSLD